MSDQPPFVFEGQPDREMITAAVRHVSRPSLWILYGFGIAVAVFGAGNIVAGDVGTGVKAQFVPLPTTSMAEARRAAMVGFLRARMAGAGAPRASVQPLPPPTP
jgi:hypothetical protein